MLSRMPPVSDLATLLRSMRPVLNPGTYVFASAPAGPAVDPARIVAAVREPEGPSLVLLEEDAARLGLAAVFRCAWITLRVESALEAVGLTAAVAAALAEDGIPCNVVAGLRHDHLFVPVERAERAMRALARVGGGAREEA
jgi:hypothetical protein